MAKKPDGRSFNLTGAADPGTPGWEERVLAAVHKHQSKSGRWTNRKSGTLLTYDPPFLELLQNAAELRGLGLAGYCRRAVAAFIAHDLDMPYFDVIRHTAKPPANQTTGGAKLRRTQDDGKGYGPWEIAQLSDD